MIEVCVLNTTEQASVLADALGLACKDVPDGSCTHVFEYVDNRLQLKALRKDAPGAVSVDFVEGALAARAKKSSIKSEAVARAVGLKKHPGLRVLDATAGLGRDSFILAHLGCEVTMLESSPFVAALLRDGLKRAVEQSVPVAARMSLREIDAVKFMRSQPLGFDVVYLDPMVRGLPLKNHSTFMDGSPMGSSLASRWMFLPSLKSNNIKFVNVTLPPPPPIHVYVLSHP